MCFFYTQKGNELKIYILTSRCTETFGFDAECSLSQCVAMCHSWALSNKLGGLAYISRMNVMSNVACTYVNANG